MVQCSDNGFEEKFDKSGKSHFDSLKLELERIVWSEGSRKRGKHDKHKLNFYLLIVWLTEQPFQPFATFFKDLANDLINFIIEFYVKYFIASETRQKLHTQKFLRFMFEICFLVFPRHFYRSHHSSRERKIFRSSRNSSELLCLIRKTRSTPQFKLKSLNVDFNPTAEN